MPRTATSIARVVLLPLAACGFSETRFEVDAIERLCELSAECEGIYDTQACIDVVRSVDRTGCDYDPKAGRDCYKELEDAACIDDALLGTSTLTIPDVCNDVYPCVPLEVGS